MAHVNLLDVALGCRNVWTGGDQIMKIVKMLLKTGYGKYLVSLF